MMKPVKDFHLLPHKKLFCRKLYKYMAHEKADDVHIFCHYACSYASCCYSRTTIFRSCMSVVLVDRHEMVACTDFISCRRKSTTGTGKYPVSGCKNFTGSSCGKSTLSF